MAAVPNEAGEFRDDNNAVLSSDAGLNHEEVPEDAESLACQRLEREIKGLKEQLAPFQIRMEPLEATRATREPRMAALRRQTQDSQSSLPELKQAAEARQSQRLTLQNEEAARSDLKTRLEIVTRQFEAEKALDIATGERRQALILSSQVVVQENTTLDTSISSKQQSYKSLQEGLPIKDQSISSLQATSQSNQATIQGLLQNIQTCDQSIAAGWIPNYPR